MEATNIKKLNIRKILNNFDIIVFTLFQILLITLSIKTSNNYISFFALFYFYFACFTGWHECVHKSNGKDDFNFISILGVLNIIPLLLLNYRNKAKQHIEHHVYTNHPEKDPDYNNNNLKFNLKNPKSSRKVGFKILDILEISLKVAFALLIYRFWLIEDNILTFICAYTLGNLLTHFIVNLYPHFKSNDDLGRDLTKNKFLSLTLLGNNLHGSHHKNPSKPWWGFLFINP